MTERCRCGDDDCGHLLFGYPFCVGVGCDQHHRAPVATDPGDRCPVDVNSELYDLADAKGLGMIPDDWSRR